MGPLRSACTSYRGVHSNLRASGLSRELYSLISDDNLASLIPSKLPGPTSFPQAGRGREVGVEALHELRAQSE